MNRREFLGTAISAATVSTLYAQTMPEWGSSILDIHFHLRQGLDANMKHMLGAGVTNAVLLTRGDVVEQVKAIQAKYPKKFIWSAGTDITKPEAEKILTKAVKDGAQGIGDMKFQFANSLRSVFDGFGQDFFCFRFRNIRTR